MYPRELDPDTDVVPVEQVEPPRRDTGTRDFDIRRLVPVLFGIQSAHGVVPPIEVEPQSSGVYAYRVRNGYHRYYAAIAMGFPKIPVTLKIVRSCAC
jgi:hypothetical protein